MTETRYIHQYRIGEQLPDGRKITNMVELGALGTLIDVWLDDGSWWRMTQRTEVRPDGFMGEAGRYPPTKLAPEEQG